MKTIFRILCGLFVLGFSTATLAVPTLQLNIEGGYYDSSDETIVTTSSVFTLDAFAKVDDFQLIIDEPVYLAVAITPKQLETPVPDIGSFKVDGTSYSTSSAEIMYGVPPVENADAIFDGGDLGKHDIYETWFLELAFNFDANNTVAQFNTQDDAGMTPTPVALTTDPDNSSTLMYMKQFEIDTSGLLEGFELHFDLYNTHVKNSKKCPNIDDCDFDINDFAPFSHDAASIPEPFSLALMGLGLAGLGIARRKRPRPSC